MTISRVVRSSIFLFAICKMTMQKFLMLSGCWDNGDWLISIPLVIGNPGCRIVFAGKSYSYNVTMRIGDEIHKHLVVTEGRRGEMR